MTVEEMAMKPDVATLVRELRATLDQIGDALISGAFDDLIATESRLAGIASGFTLVLGGGPATVPPSELDEALTALRRCQRLGTSFAEMGTSWIGAGEGNAYTRTGGRTPASTSFAGGAAIDTRV